MTGLFISGRHKLGHEVRLSSGKHRGKLIRDPGRLVLVRTASRSVGTCELLDAKNGSIPLLFQEKMSLLRAGLPWSIVR